MRIAPDRVFHYLWWQLCARMRTRHRVKRYATHFNYAAVKNGLSRERQLRLRILMYDFIYRWFIHYIYIHVISHDIYSWLVVPHSSYNFPYRVSSSVLFHANDTSKMLTASQAFVVKIFLFAKLQVNSFASKSYHCDGTRERSSKVQVK